MILPSFNMLRRCWFATKCISRSSMSTRKVLGSSSQMNFAGLNGTIWTNNSLNETNGANSGLERISSIQKHKISFSDLNIGPTEQMGPIMKPQTWRWILVNEFL